MIVQRILPLQPGMTQSVVTAGMDFMSNGIIRPNGLSSTVSLEGNYSKKSFPNTDLHKNNKNPEDIDSASTSTTIKSTSEISMDNASSSKTVIEIIDESQSSEQQQKTTENVEDDPCIQSIMDLSLPSPMSANGNMDECKFIAFCTFVYDFSCSTVRFQQISHTTIHQ